MRVHAMILITGSVIAREGRLAEALALSLEHVRRSRLEPGCISHAVHHDAENPNRLFFFEQWADQAAVAAHFVVPASRAFVKALGVLATEAPQLAMYDGRRLTN
jgi:quinol monooxygenase YgiN